MSDDYSAVTRNICVRVRSFFLPDQSRPEDNHFVWAYRVKIENQGDETVQLQRRTWRITDERGKTLLVQGEGVIGQKPIITPGQSFEYASGTPLDTPSGFMVGHYHMIFTATSVEFDVDIPIFSLDSPYRAGMVH
jgi:ApaG protein